MRVTFPHYVAEDNVRHNITNDHKSNHTLKYSATHALS